MERASLQREWALGKFDDRTVNRVTLGESAALRRIYGSEVSDMQGAGRPSRQRLEPEEEVRLQKVNSEAVDWAGNVMPLNRKRAVLPKGTESQLFAHNGFITSSSSADEARPRALIGSKNQLESSDGILQTCPEATHSAEWKSSNQMMMDTGTVPQPRSSKTIPSRRGYAGVNQLEQFEARRHPKHSASDKTSLTGKSSFNPATFGGGVDALSIARSMKKDGAFLARNAHFSASSAAASNFADKTLITQNYSQAIPGCTYYNAKPR